MRRKFAYILLAGSLLLGAAATIGPTIVKLDTDVSLSSGRDLVFRISNYGTTYNGIQTENYVYNDNYAAVNAVADEFTTRLTTWGTQGTVTKEGFSTIRVTIRSQENNSDEYGYLEKYLPFSGGSVSVDASDTTGTDYGKLPGWTNIFEGQTARVEYLEQDSGKLPVVVVPLKTVGSVRGEDGDYAKLLKYCKDNTTEAKEGDSSSSSKQCLVTYWSHMQEGDNYVDATKDTNRDINMYNRIFFAQLQDYGWYTKDKEKTDKDYYDEAQLIPSSAAIQSGKFDSTKTDSAAKAAKLYMNMLNAEDYKNIGAGYDISFAYEATAAATAENLVTKTGWDLTPAWGKTLISTLVAFAVAAVILVLFYGLGALAILSNVAVAVMGALLFCVYFHAQFGVGALVGLVLVGLIAAFGGAYYFAKIKEQLYLGRSLKKAHTEAAKKALWPTIDASLVAIILGLCVYAWVPDVIGKMGLMLVFGSVFAGLSNLLILRLEGWLLANDNTVEGQIQKVYNVDTKKIPDALKDEKPSYFGPYANHDFQKPAKWVSIVMASLVLASIIGVSVFTAIKGSTTYNTAAADANTTSLSVEYRLQDNDSAKESNKLPSTDEFETAVLYKIGVKNSDGTTKIEAFSSADYGEVTLTEGASTLYYSEEEESWKVYYFTVDMNAYYGDTLKYIYTFGGTDYGTFREALEAAVVNVAGENTYVGVDEVTHAVSTPSMASLWLGLGVGLLIDMVYMMIRYRPSRGFAAGVLAFASSALVCGFFALTRIPVTPLVSGGAVVAGLLTLVYSLFILGKEKELYKESRERDKDTLAFRSECLTSGVKESAGEVVVMLLMSAFVFVLYYGFAPSVWQYLFLGSLFGVVAVAVLALYVLAPFAIQIAKFLSRFHFNFHPFKKETPEQTKHKSAEPEEAVFIGIND